MESQNDGRVNELSSKVAALKAVGRAAPSPTSATAGLTPAEALAGRTPWLHQLTIDIGNEVRSQNALLDTMVRLPRPNLLAALKKRWAAS